MPRASLRKAMNNSKKEGKASHRKQRPAQHQKRQPGRQSLMRPPPIAINTHIQGSEKLKGKVALITGGDSGIGQACAIAFAREGAQVAIIYLEERKDAERTADLVRKAGSQVLLIKGDIARESFCKNAVLRVARQFGKLDILVNNAAEQHPQRFLTAISARQLHRTFATNLYSMFFLTKAALPHLKKNKGVVLNTASVTAYRGSPALLDYSASKGGIVSFTRSLSQQLIADGIRVNAVAPGPIWTPLIPATFDKAKVKTFGADTPMGRAGQPWECAECFVFLASEQASYMTGQVLHPNGGEIING
jgi:NAD(P)-dependent dehydrogenase (short-subunit alcohol dehydrogenase family)